MTKNYPAVFPNTEKNIMSSPNVKMNKIPEIKKIADLPRTRYAISNKDYGAPGQTSLALKNRTQLMTT